MMSKQILTLIAGRDKQEKITTSNNNLVFYQDNKITSKIPLTKIQIIIIIGEMTITTPLLTEMSKLSITIVFCKYNFEMTYRLVCNSYSSLSLKTNQFQIIQDTNSKLSVAKHIINNKIKNQITKPQTIKLTEQLTLVTSEQQLLGLEGSYSSIYFQNLYSPIGWTSRKPRQKPDITNFLLDIGYTFLYNFVGCLLSQIGWEINFGFLHQNYYQRQSLTCDLMEPIRPIIDKSILKAFNLKKINKNDFELIDNKIKLKDYKLSSKYTSIFLDTITNNQDEIWTYLSSFAKAVERLELDNLPEFVC